MRKFDYSFLNNGLLPSNFINLTSNIASLKTMAGVRKEEFAKVFTELEAVAKVQSVKSSNAIEGIVTSDERIAAIVNQDSAPLNHTEGEIAYVTKEDQKYQYTEEKGWQVYKAPSVAEMSLYDLNKQIISQMPDIEDFTEAYETIDQYHKDMNNKYYMLLIKDLNYYTIFRFCGQYFRLFFSLCKKTIFFFIDEPSLYNTAAFFSRP
jgi:hypothetical protein